MLIYDYRIYKVWFKTFSGEPEFGTGRACIPTTVLYKLDAKQQNIRAQHGSQIRTKYESTYQHLMFYSQILKKKMLQASDVRSDPYI